MLKLLLMNQKLMAKITSKLMTKCLKKSFDCKTVEVTCKDIVIMDKDENSIIVHFNGDISMSKDELLKIIENKIEDSE